MLLLMLRDSRLAFHPTHIGTSLLKANAIISSNINEVIRAVLNFFFFTKTFYTHKKAQKRPKAQKAQKRK